ncbi:hypothetical protein DUI87_09749 [Hirundo rustica rustica]|uniref:Uncharacterized protein n=1 Tax=Hirundo rustica rustica TaxID=333673 RepID=A0A3M0KG78_HIRRU|nr:hypothetical protein DUI87_09749 [Hirundo rustica rustica]
MLVVGVEMEHAWVLVVYQTQGETCYYNSQVMFPAHLLAIHLNLWDNGFSFCPLGGDEPQNSVQNLGMRGKSKQNENPNNEQTIPFGCIIKRLLVEDGILMALLRNGNFLVTETGSHNMLVQYDPVVLLL